MSNKNMQFKVDYAKVGYSTCRSCEAKKIANNKIAKGTLRIGIVQQVFKLVCKIESL